MAYKTFTGKGNANEWQRSSKKNQYSDKLVGAGISSEKSKFLKDLASDLSQIYGVVSGGVDGVLGAIGSKFASVQQDSEGNIFKNPGDTTKIPPMITKGSYKAGGGGVLKDADGFKVKSGSGPITYGNGPQYGTARGINMRDIAGELNTKGNALSDPRIKSRMGSGEAQEFFNSTPNFFSPSVQGTNPLLDFETMSYVITFSCLDLNAYNTDNYRDNPGVVIAKTGGKGRGGTGPLAYDYFIERLELEATVHPVPEAFATNTYKINFNVTEPLGVDLIPALIEASQRQGYQNHLSAVYLLTIEFVGNDDNGIPRKIPGVTRYIPMMLYNVELAVDEGGGSYSIQAMPYNYRQQLEEYDILKEAVVHQGTDVNTLVQNFFTSLNGINTVKKDEDKITVKPNLYEFNVEDSNADILKSKLGFDDPGASSNNTINVSPAGGPGGGDSISRKVTVQKHVSIVEYLTQVVQNSKFIVNQFGADNESKMDVINTVKIMVSTIIVDKDNGQGEPQYKFRYALTIQRHAIESANVEPVRTYNYIYTGENKDVLELDLKYNFAYFQPGRYHDAMQNKLKNDDGDVSAGESQTNQGPSFDDASLGKGGTSPAKQPTNDMPTDQPNPDAPMENREMADIFRKILEDPAADLIVVDLSILGDPYWIEQKSIKAGSKRMTSNGQTEPDGSVSPDANNIVVQLNARYPSDLDDETGLMRLNLSAFFKGKFKVYNCASLFEGGVFTNTLTMTRFREQENDIKTFPAKGIPNRGGARPGAGTNLQGGSFNDNALGKSSGNVIYKNKNNTGPNGYISIDKIANNTKKSKNNKVLRRLNQGLGL